MQGLFFWIIKFKDTFHKTQVIRSMETTRNKQGEEIKGRVKMYDVRIINK